jgi:pantothenate kinase
MEIKTREQLFSNYLLKDKNDNWVKVDDIINDLKYVIDIEKELLIREYLKQYIKVLSQSNPTTNSNFVRSKKASDTTLDGQVGNDTLINFNKDRFKIK